MLLDNAFSQSWGRRGAASGPVLSAPDLKCQGRDSLGQMIGGNALLGIFVRYSTILQKSFEKFLGEILWQVFIFGEKISYTCLKIKMNN